MFLPMNRAEMLKLGWDYLDIVLVTGDAYVDHPSFGTAIIGQYLVANGFKTGIIACPDIKNNETLTQLPAPRLFFGITSGNVDSMICNYTANKKYRSDDDYAAGGQRNFRPDRAVIAYTGKIRELYKNVPVIIGGIEASLRRFPHYDYWSNKVRSSVLFDSKADLLVFGQGEKAILAIAESLAAGKTISQIRNLPNTAYLVNTEPADTEFELALLPAFPAVAESHHLFTEMNKIIHNFANPYLKTGFKQQLRERWLIVNPVQEPSTTAEMDSYYDLPFERNAHPSYTETIPAFEMIKNSVTIHRGCFGGCSFCAIGLHQGKFIQSRSENSILKEVTAVDAKTLTDLGGPSANMYGLGGVDSQICKKCTRASCLFPQICNNLNTNHKSLLELYDKVSAIKKFFINSGIRHELALMDKKYLKRIAEQHTSGLLKIAPEHVIPEVLEMMYKPSIDKYEEFVKLFKLYSTREQFVLPYLISAFPGCSNEAMYEMMHYLEKNKIRVEQVQDFLPTPLTVAGVSYYTERNFTTNEPIFVAKSEKERHLHRAMLQSFKPQSRRLITEYEIISRKRASKVESSVPLQSVSAKPVQYNKRKHP